MQIDPWILAFSAATVIATVWMGFWSARRSKTAHDFYVAGRSVSVGWNASAISGEYLSAASFMGVAGMVMSSGYDALWYPVCYACGYLFLLLFIAGPLRRFGAYTIPDFAEGRFDSPVFRKIAVVFVLFIGFFYTMPQMKGAGTTLAYIFPGLPYWAGVVLVGAVITLNVALGGMKGITLVQAFQYWAKMFAISVPIFVLMAVYGHYGRQVGANDATTAEGLLSFENIYRSPSDLQLKARDLVGDKVANAVRLDAPDYAGFRMPDGTITLLGLLKNYGLFQAKEVYVAAGGHSLMTLVAFTTNHVDRINYLETAKPLIAENGFKVVYEDHAIVKFALTNLLTSTSAERTLLPDKALEDKRWLNPFGPLTTKAAKAAAAAIGKRATNASWSSSFSLSGGTLKRELQPIPLRADLSPDQRMSVNFSGPSVSQVLSVYAELTGRLLLPRTNSVAERIDELLEGTLSRWKLVTPTPAPDNGARFHADGMFTAAEVQAAIEAQLRTNGIALLPVGGKYFRAVAAEVTRLTAADSQSSALYPQPTNQSLLTSAPTTAEKAWLAKHERPLALLYTYSLIIALVCGTAGLPHILVRFYTNPDGVAAKRTTMWVMILIGVFYLFPPVFGVMGRNLLSELYAGVGAKGTDKIVLELPKVLDADKAGRGEREKRGKGEISSAPLPPFPPSAEPGNKRSDGFPWGSILSGITCAGAFAAFMSTFSGLLVSMTGALAHDVYGRMLRPQSTPQQRMRAFRVCAVIIGAVAILLGMQVEPFQINFMVGQAFAIAAASYFPLLFVSCWWRGLTMKGAATGMLAGGLLALIGITLTSFSDLKWLPLDAFWAVHPLSRILCEQPAIWTVPLAITLMVVVSRLTKKEIPADIRMKMLVLHAPEKLGLKQEYIQEHQAH